MLVIDVDIFCLLCSPLLTFIGVLIKQRFFTGYKVSYVLLQIIIYLCAKFHLHWPVLLERFSNTHIIFHIYGVVHYLFIYLLLYRTQNTLLENLFK